MLALALGFSLGGKTSSNLLIRGLLGQGSASQFTVSSSDSQSITRDVDGCGNYKVPERIMLSHWLDAPINKMGLGYWLRRLKQISLDVLSSPTKIKVQRAGSASMAGCDFCQISVCAGLLPYHGMRTCKLIQDAFRISFGTDIGTSHLITVLVELLTAWGWEELEAR